MTLETGYAEIAAFAGSDDGRKRREMLGLARRLAGGPAGVAALLWLYDKDKARLHLDHYEPLDEPRRELRRLSLPFSPDDARNRSVHAAAAATAGSDVVRLWADRAIPWAHRELFLVSPRDSTGFLEILTPDRLGEDARTLLRSFAEVVAGRITRHRDARKLQVFAQLTTLQPEKIAAPDQGTHRWLSVAAEVAAKTTAARAAVVFCESPDMNLKAMAWSPTYANANRPAPTAAANSLVRWAYEQKKPVRILNHTDEAERQAETGRTDFDAVLTRAVEAMAGGGPLRSWIAAPVICDGEPLAVLMVVNKKPDDYLPEAFSGTDFQLVQSICDVVSRGLAQSRTNQAVRAISSFTFERGTLFGQDTKSLVGQKELLTLVRGHVPGLVAGGVSLRFRSDEKPVDWWPLGELQPGLTDFLFRQIDRPFRQAVGPVLGPPVTGDDGSKCYVYEEHLPFGGNDRLAAVHLLTRRDKLAKHHQDVLKYLNADIGQLVRSELMVRHHVEELTQIRHAIRSGLQGVRHIETAYSIYKQIAQKGMQPSDFRVAMLRKSLEWTKLFADRCSNLMEESRFLLGRIRAEELRTGGTSIVKLVTETLTCLRPYADERGVALDFRNLIRSERTVTMDRQLMGIAVFNVIDNAIKYSHRNKPVTVILDVTSRSWELQVSDRGVYIDPKDWDAIFRPFVRRPTGQAQNTRPGTGLGLAVVKQIIDAHQGQVSVDSVPLDRNRPTDGADTTFTMTVPG